VLWAALFRHQPVQQNLAVMYRALGGDLRLKATLFEPVRGIDQEVKRLALAQRNGEVVKALNVAKESILSRMEAIPSQRMQFYLRLYFIAQDVHERPRPRTLPTANSPRRFSTATCCFAASACCGCRAWPAPRWVRLGMALTIGDGVLHLIHVHHRYWIPLTTLFVC
jgi:uncharacterized membrane protein YccC